MATPLWVYSMCVLFVTSCTLINADVTDVSTANNDLALRMYNEIGKSAGSDNIFLSPFSIFTALSMTYLGSKGETQLEMKNQMGISGINNGDIHDLSRQLNAIVFDPTKNYTLLSANRIFGKTGVTFLSSFLNDIETYYNASLKQLDFVNKTEESRIYINEWVANRTAMKIKDLLGEGMITQDTILVLVNAIYFKGFWKLPFNSENTKNEDFHLGASKSEKVDMMTMTANFKMATLSTFSVLELDYFGNDVSMLFLLPKKSVSLKSVEAQLNNEKLTSAISDLKSKRVHLKLPKFNVTHKELLKAHLEKLGMVKMFTNSADFSGMTTEQDLKVSQVIHQAFVVVNEIGTEAGAATAVTMVGVSIQPEPVEFFLDRPFLFLIREKSTNTILFIGRVISPTGAGTTEKPGPNSAPSAWCGMWPSLTILPFFLTMLINNNA